MFPSPNSKGQEDHEEASAEALTLLALRPSTMRLLYLRPAHQQQQVADILRDPQAE